MRQSLCERAPPFHRLSQWSEEIRVESRHFVPHRADADPLVVEKLVVEVALMASVSVPPSHFLPDFIHPIRTLFLWTRWAETGRTRRMTTLFTMCNPYALIRMSRFFFLFQILQMAAPSPLRQKRTMSVFEDASSMSNHSAPIPYPFAQRKRLQQLNTAHPVPAMDEQDCQSRLKRSRVVDETDENLDMPVRLN